MIANKPQSHAELKQRVYKIVLLGIAIAIVSIIAFPYYWMIVSSLESGNIFQWPPKLVPSSVSFDAYRELFQERPIAIWFRNSVIVSVSATLFSIAFSINAESLGIEVAARVAISAETTANSASDAPVVRSRASLTFFILNLNTVIMYFDSIFSNKCISF